ncbi:MAG: hypothetical protein L3J45_06080 [Flavobacteriaceae bacterium]|nr:hypothetical protein [Flavobacteriaceae bacterium]
MQGEETSFQITIIKEKLKNTIKKILELTETYYNKKIVFANALLPYGTIWEAIAHCTHLQIAPASLKAKFAKECNYLPH